jgi:hypothetical protein
MSSTLLYHLEKHIVKQSTSSLFLAVLLCALGKQHMKRVVMQCMRDGAVSLQQLLLKIAALYCLAWGNVTPQ